MSLFPAFSLAIARSHPTLKWMMSPIAHILWVDEKPGIMGGGAVCNIYSQLVNSREDSSLFNTKTLIHNKK